MFARVGTCDLSRWDLGCLAPREWPRQVHTSTNVGLSLNRSRFPAGQGGTRCPRHASLLHLRVDCGLRGGAGSNSTTAGVAPSGFTRAKGGEGVLGSGHMRLLMHHKQLKGVAHWRKVHGVIKGLLHSHMLPRGPRHRHRTVLRSVATRANNRHDRQSCQAPVPPASPKRWNRAIRRPTTPPTTDPVWMPTRIWRGTPWLVLTRLRDKERCRHT